MNTFLSQAQISSRKRYQDFALENLAPIAKALESRRASLPDFLSKLGQAGYMGLTAPTEHGGQAASFLDLALLIESLGRHEPGVAVTLANHAAALELVKKFGSDEQKSRYLPALASGEMIGTCAFSEENAGSDFKAVQSLAIKQGDRFMLSGKKVWVPNAEIAGLMIAACRMDEAENADDGLSLFMVDPVRGAEIEISPDRGKLGLRSVYTNDVEFKSLGIASANLLARPAVEAMLYAMDIAKVLVAAAALGLSEAALDQAVNHARRREQFGKNIGQFQGIQWKLADFAAELEGARLQTYRAAWSKDESPDCFPRHAAMCKWFAARTARMHSGEAVQVLASFGIDAEGPLERFYRDAKMTEICQGTSEFQKVLLVKALGI